MMKKLEERRVKIVQKRYAEGKGFVGREKLIKTRPGTYAKNPKVSKRFSHRPRVVSGSNVRGAKCYAWYFNTIKDHSVSSKEYRKGNWSVTFPPGTYRPYVSGAPPSSK